MDRRTFDKSRMFPALLQKIAERGAKTRFARGVRFPLLLSERKVLLFLTDVAAALVALLAVLIWRFRLPLAWQTLVTHYAWFALLTGLWAVWAPLLNAYDLRRASRVSSGVSAGVLAGLVVGAVYLSIPYITPPLHTSRLTAGSFVLLMVTFVAAGRAAYATLLVQPAFRHRILIAGAGWAGRTLVEALRTHAGTAYEVAGYIDDDPSKQKAIIEGLPVLGTRQDLARIVREREISEVVIAITRYDTIDGELAQALMDCHEQGVRMTAMPVLYERLTGRVPVEHVGRGLHLVLPVHRELNRFYLLAKRGMDIFFGLLGGVAMLLVLPLIALASLIDSPGPLFYRQERMGRGGRLFRLIKFRTMVPDAEADGPRWAQEEDARVTRVGRILRQLHLDELPQAINLLRGEMSFIGPRPERPEFVASLEREIPFYRARHVMRPGITGWAQVNYGYASSTDDALIKLQYDLYYNKHCSLFLDLAILVRTLGLVLTFRGR